MLIILKKMTVHDIKMKKRYFNIFKEIHIFFINEDHTHNTVIKKNSRNRAMIASIFCFLIFLYLNVQTMDVYYIISCIFLYNFY
jgi:hypothetical protein